MSPVLIYAVYTYYKHRDNVVIQSRCFALTMSYCLFLIAGFIVERPLYLGYMTMYDGPGPLTHSSFDQWLFGLVSGLAHYGTIHLSNFLLLVKYYSIYFKIEWTKETMNGKWKVHINHVELHQNWYLKNKSKYGSDRYLVKLASVPWFVTSALSILSIQLYVYPLFISMQLLSWVLLTMFPIVLWFKMRRFEDSFYLMAELKVTTCLYVLGTVYYVAINTAMSTGQISFRVRCHSMLSLESLYFAMYIYIYFLCFCFQIVYRRGLIYCALLSVHSLSNFVRGQESELRPCKHWKSSECDGHRDDPRGCRVNAAL